LAVNYLNNRDMMREIHRSKISYCWFADAKYHNYDVICQDLGEVVSKIVDARAARAARMSAEAFEAARATDRSRRADEFAVDPNTIDHTELVFRVMTWAHIPESASWIEKQEAAETDDELQALEDNLDRMSKKHVRVNFPPFEHYVLDADQNLVCVGRSHWQGDLENGEFCRDHGQMTRQLAEMFMKLCERYARRGNWRNYTYIEEMQGQALLHLSHIGLQFDESKSSNPFSYYTQSLTNSFTRVLNIEKKHQNIRDDILEMNNMMPSYTRQNWSTGSNNNE
jgi:hypothetical protein